MRCWIFRDEPPRAFSSLSLLAACLAAAALLAGSTSRAQEPQAPADATPQADASTAESGAGPDAAPATPAPAAGASTPDAAPVTPASEAGTSTPGSAAAADSGSATPAPEAETPDEEDLGDEPEPNDSFGTAPSVPATGAWKAAIEPQRDVDWFAFQVDRQGALDIHVTQVPADLEVSVRIWDAEKNPVSDWFQPLRPGADTEGSVDLPAPGEYVIEVRETGDNAHSAEPFTVRTRFTPAVDEHEPNDSFGSAGRLALGEEIQANLLPQRDSDWFRFEVEQAGELQVRVLRVPETLDLVVRVWTANRDPLGGWFSPLRAGGDTEALVDLPAAGVYVLELRDQGDNARATAPYTLQTRFAPVVDRHEPNDSFGTAVPLSPGEVIQANILPQRDADWFRLQLDGKGELEVRVTHVPRELDIVFRLWNAEKQTVSSWAQPLRQGGDTRALIDVPAAGRYTLEVRDQGDNARAIEPYTLDLTFRPAPAE